MGRFSSRWFRENWLLHSALALYAVALFTVIAYHEPWADEAQAWLLARDSGPLELLFQRLHYEGHPGLWYLVLFLPSKLLPYRSISVFSGCIAILGVAMLLYRSPFPEALRVLFPFTYFIFYQYAVIARSYVLVPLMLFAIACVYPRRHERFIMYTVLVCLLAYISIYTSLIACVLMLMHFVEWLQARREMDADLVRRHMAVYGVFLLGLVLILIQLWQPQDSSFAVGFHFNPANIYSLSKQILNEIMTEIGPISAILLLLSLLWFWQRRLLLVYVMSTLAILGLFAIKYYNSWHQGVLFVFWVFVMWLSFDRETKGRWETGTRLLRPMAVGVCVIVAGFHIYWAAVSSYHDWKGPYSAAKATAEYIRQNNLTDKPIYGTTFWTTAVQPYFKHNIFANHNGGHLPAYWLWALDNGRMEDREQMLREQPELIVVGRPGTLRELPGYRFVALYEGNIYWKDGIKERNSFGLFRRE